MTNTEDGYYRNIERTSHMNYASVARQNTCATSDNAEHLMKVRNASQIDICIYSFVFLSSYLNGLEAQLFKGWLDKM